LHTASYAGIMKLELRNNRRMLLLVTMLIIVVVIFVTLEVIFLNDAGVIGHVFSVLKRQPLGTIIFSAVAVFYGFRTWKNRALYLSELKRTNYKKVAAIVAVLWACSVVQPYALVWWFGTDFPTVVFFERAWLIFLACVPAIIWLLKKVGKINDHWPVPVAILATAVAIPLLAGAAVTSIFTSADERPVDKYLCQIQDRDFEEFAAKMLKENSTFVDGAGCSPSNMTWRDYLAQLFNQSLA
jgi:hypothetical protein